MLAPVTNDALRTPLPSRAWWAQGGIALLVGIEIFINTPLFENTVKPALTGG